jgi:hypothetical protein
VFSLPVSDDLNRAGIDTIQSGSLGKCLAISLKDKLSLYSIKTLDELVLLEKGQHTDIFCIQASPCKRILVSVERRQISVWDVSSVVKMWQHPCYRPKIKILSCELLVFENSVAMGKVQTKNKRITT